MAAVAHLIDRDPRVRWHALAAACDRCFHVWAAVFWAPRDVTCPRCAAPATMITFSAAER